MDMARRAPRRIQSKSAAQDDVASGIACMSSGWLNCIAHTAGNVDPEGQQRGFPG